MAEMFKKTIITFLLLLLTSCGSDSTPVVNNAAGSDTDVDANADAGTDTTLPDVAENQPPVALGQTVTTLEQTTLEITLEGTDPDGDTLTFAIASMPADATLFFSGQTATFTADAGFSGSTSFTFLVNDGTVDSAPATVSVIVENADDPPVVTITSPADGASVFEYETVTLDGTAIDAEDGDLTATIVWNSQIDGELGTGAPVEDVKLTVGSHQLTANVPNSAGSALIGLEVLAAEEFPHGFYGSAESEFGGYMAATDKREIFLCANTTGFPAMNTGGNDILTYKLDSTGTAEWMSLVGSTENDICFDIAADGQKAVVVGTTLGSLEQIPFEGVNDAFIIRHTESGGIDFAKTYGTASNEQFAAVATAPDGKIAAVGRTGGDLFGTSLSNGNDGMIVVLDANGDLIWSHQFVEASGEFTDVAFDADGNIVIAGRSRDGLWGATGNSSQNIVGKFTPTGTEIWTKAYGTDRIEIHTKVTTFANDVILAFSTDGVFVAGTAVKDTFQYDLGIIRLDTNGDEIWRHQEPFVGAFTTGACVVDSTGVYIVGASPPGAAPVYAFDPAGVKLWEATVGVSTVAQGVALSYGHLLISGHSGPFDGLSTAGRTDVFITSLPTTGP